VTGGTSEEVNGRGRRPQAAKRGGNEAALKTLIDSAAGYDTERRELLEAIVTAGSPVLMPLMRSFEKLPLQADNHLRMGMIVARLAERGLCNKRSTSWRTQIEMQARIPASGTDRPASREATGIAPGPAQFVFLSPSGTPALRRPSAMRWVWAV
jgi:hypothetical protein